ncbi:cyanobacterial porin [Chlorella sorokiniana]|uniref:Cyanobacterial porin n=1 Tax=Chlorella sorokiniana TaxID=3076 RepID=A0A2P6TS83_CHLSO|nr:cyanobacterial porin [Chlorella sorokiniana]|eukprot:PRW56917.1 cyanobacterial porin [Chlorella sorokiniana]
MLAVAAAAALGLFSVGSKRLQLRRQLVQAGLGRQAGESSDVSPAATAAGASFASSEDVATLTRLTQELFTELVKVRARLDELEEDAGISASSGSAPADATLVGSDGGGRRSKGLAVNGSGSGGQQQHARHRLAGVVRLGGGLMWAQDDATAESSRGLQAAGIKLGTDVLLQLSGLVRGGRDSVQAECKVNPAAEQLSLRKVLYNCRLSQRARLILAPFGARGRDAAYTLNPLAGQGLTSLVREGSPLHSPVLGSLAGVALETRRAWLNAGYFARATPGGGSAWSVLAQAVVAPTSSLSAGMTYLHHSSGAAASAAAAAADPAAAAAAAAGGGPAMVGALERAAAPFGAPAAQRQLGSTLAWRLGEDAVLHGWAAADADEVEHSVRAGRLADVRPQQWGLLLGSFPDGSGNGWAAGAGHSAAAAGGGAAGNRLLPNLYELSLQFNLGDGLTLTPGMVVLAPRGGRTTALLGVRTAWSF